MMLIITHHLLSKIMVTNQLVSKNSAFNFHLDFVSCINNTAGIVIPVKQRKQ